MEVGLSMSDFDSYDFSKERPVNKYLEERMRDEQKLIAAIQQNEEKILLLHEKANSKFCLDRIYRYYHHSFKLYSLQEVTNEIFQLIEELNPNPRRMNKDFLDIIFEGTNHEFVIEDNNRWNLKARPIVEAFFHAKHILEMIVRYGLEAEDKERSGNSFWFTVLYIYNLR